MWICNTCDKQRTDLEARGRCTRCGGWRFHRAPSTRTIRARCEQVRRKWSRAVEAQRRGESIYDHYEIPQDVELVKER